MFDKCWTHAIQALRNICSEALLVTVGSPLFTILSSRAAAQLPPSRSPPPQVPELGPEPTPLPPDTFAVKGACRSPEEERFLQAVVSGLRRHGTVLVPLAMTRLVEVPGARAASSTEEPYRLRQNAWNP